MSLEFSPDPKQESEARITALLLGELTGAEAASLLEAIEADPQLAALYERLKKTVVIVREVSANPVEPVAAQGATAPLKLSEERRQKLLAQFKTVKPKEFVALLPQSRPRRNFRVLELAAVLALMAILAGLMLPALSKAKSKAVSVSIRSNLKQIQLAKQIWADENNKTANDSPTLKDLEPYMGRGSQVIPPSISGEKYVIGRVGEQASAELDSEKAKKVFGKAPVGLNTLSGGRIFKFFPSTPPEQLARLTADGQVAFVDGNSANPSIKLRAKFADVTQSAPGKPAEVPPLAVAQNNRQQIYLPPDDSASTATIVPAAPDQKAEDQFGRLRTLSDGLAQQSGISG
ncbi:MAG TPA: hypothetical protein VG754_04475, partial [Verrucomicrobiae bacterium]|nr:hypothetical protein [Verrucomicrobiae bacterium]